MRFIRKMPLFRRPRDHRRDGLDDRDLADVIAMAAAVLGPEVVSNPADLLNAERAASVDLPALLDVIGGQPRDQWATTVHAYYAANGQMIRQGIALEARAQSFAEARGYLGAMLEAGSPEGRVGVSVPGIVAGTRYVPVLQDGDTVRAILPSMLARWGVGAGEVLAAAREHVAAMPARLDDIDDVSGTYWLNVAPSVSVGLAIESLDQVAPQAVGPLGTIVSVLAPNLAAVRPLTFAPGLREGFASLAQAHASWRASDQSIPHEALLWRRPKGEVVTIDMSMAPGPRGLRLNVADVRFRGVLTAVEPKELLPVPRWASGIFDAERYTQFAGVVAAGLSLPAVPPDHVADLADKLPLAPAARICATVDPDAWPRVVGSMSRIGIRQGPQGTPHGSLDKHWPRGQVEAVAGDLIPGLRSVIADMPAITKAGLSGSQMLRLAGPVKPGVPLADQPGVRMEKDLEVLVAHTGEGDVGQDLDRLMAACAVLMPPDVFTSVKAIGADDPCFADHGHLVDLR